MKRQPRGSSLFVCLLNLFTVLLLVVASSNNSVLAAPAPGETPGSLAIVGKDGKIQGDCPLKHTDVRAGISGFLARVTVTQTFSNTATAECRSGLHLPAPAGCRCR